MRAVAERLPLNNRALHLRLHLHNLRAVSGRLSLHDTSKPPHTSVFFPSLLACTSLMLVSTRLLLSY